MASENFQKIENSKMSSNNADGSNGFPRPIQRDSDKSFESWISYAQHRLTGRGCTLGMNPRQEEIKFRESNALIVKHFQIPRSLVKA
jgi:hypothetical protein